MTEAAQRKPKPPRRLPVGAPVLWTGIALGTFLAVEALRHGVMLSLFGGFADAILTFVLILAAGVGLAELTRRHHRAVARHSWRHGKRGALATARHGRRGASAAYRGARKHGGTGAAFIAAKARSRWDGWRAQPQQEEPEWLDAPPLSEEWDVPVPDPAPAPRPPNPTGGTSTMPASPSRIKTQHRAQRAAARAGGTVPSEWGPVIAQTADFEPEDDGELLEWMTRQVTGLSAWAEALVDFYDHATNTIGIDPKASAMLHDVADAAAQAAETMSGASRQFAEHYELPREFAANGGLMTHDGRWITGDGA